MRRSRSATPPWATALALQYATLLGLADRRAVDQVPIAGADGLTHSCAHASITLLWLHKLYKCETK